MPKHLTQQQVETVELLWGTCSRWEVAQAAGITEAQLAYRRADDLKHLPSIQGRGGGRPWTEYNPSPKEIRQATREIQRRWSPMERIERRAGAPDQHQSRKW